MTEAGWLDATKIDLSGVPGVTAEQQAAAEELLRNTVSVVPSKWPTYDDAIRDGFKPDGTPPMGFRHVFHWDWVSDGHEFDPNRPEALVYRQNPTTKKLELATAMYLLEGGATIDNTETKFGDLAQLHSHTNFCWEIDPENNTGRVIPGLSRGKANCVAPAKNLDTAMVHVWVIPNACGPFSELTGAQAGITKSGTNNCDPAHGSETPGGESPGEVDFDKLLACLEANGLKPSPGAVPNFDDPKFVEAMRKCGPQAGAPVPVP